jgi:hypothetical protein
VTLASACFAGQSAVQQVSGKALRLKLSRWTKLS